MLENLNASAGDLLGLGAWIHVAGGAGLVLLMLMVELLLTKRAEPMDRIGRDRRGGVIEDDGNERLSRHGARSGHLATWSQHPEIRDAARMSRTRTLPMRADALDLLAVGVEAGRSLDRAILRRAAGMRHKRGKRAEETAAVPPGKPSIGTMTVCVPPLLVVPIGPLLHGIATALSGTGGF